MGTHWKLGVVDFGYWARCAICTAPGAAFFVRGDNCVGSRAGGSAAAKSVSLVKIAGSGRVRQPDAGFNGDACVYRRGGNGA